MRPNAPRLLVPVTIGVLAIAGCNTAVTATPTPASTRPSSPSASPAETTPDLTAGPTAEPSGELVPVPTAGAPLWSLAAQLPGPRRGHTATLLLDGRVLVVGGEDGSDIRASAELFTGGLGSQGFWEDAASLPVSRSGHLAIRLTDGRVLVIGGETVKTPPLALRVPGGALYDPATNRWSAVPDLPGAHEAISAVLLADGRVLVLGAGSVDVYNPKTNSWSAKRMRPHPTIRPTMTLLDDGTVLVAGGIDPVGDQASPRANAQIYRPGTDTWTDLADMPIALMGHTAVRLVSGRILIVGDTAALLFDQTTRTWSQTSPPLAAEGEHAAVHLADGRVLVVGTGDQEIAEVYDPATAAWTSAGVFPMTAGLTATLLQDGPVLVVGGTVQCRSGEICDPGGPPIFGLTYLFDLAGTS